MPNDQIKLITVLMIISILLCLIPCVNFIYKKMKFRKSEMFYSTSLSARLMFHSFFLISSIFCLRLVISYYKNNSGLSSVEMIFDSLLQSLQTVTMGEDGSEFVTSVKYMIMETYSSQYTYLVAGFFGIFVSLLNLLAPITSAVAVFSMLTVAFPKLKLILSFLKKQYYFSELNERSLALAKSIVNSKTGFLNHPVLVFTDVYVDDENEKSSELYIIAKKMGAICVKDDIVHIKAKTLKEKEIFLLDEKESDNIKHLSELNSGKANGKLKNTFVYVFYQDDAYALIENKIKLNIEERYKKSRRAPVVLRVKEYENLILNLLAEKPLVEPLIRNFNDNFLYPKSNEKDEREEYNLTIIGSGKIGLQMMLSASWCGQFYGYKLNINVVSDEKKEDFERKINNLYPEFIESAKSNSPHLKVFEDCEIYNEPYFQLRYGEYKFNDVSLSEISCKSFTDNTELGFDIIDSDYFLIAIGSDEANILAAENLKKQLTIIGLNSEKEKVKNRVIAFAVYNQSFNDILKRNAYDNDYKIEIFPFGSIGETYSYQNITMVKKDPAAIAVGETYLKQSYKENSVAEKKGIQDEQNKKIYEIMSSKARDIHFKYRVFSAFLINKNNQTAGSDKSWEVLNAIDDKTIKAYEHCVLSKEAIEQRESILQYLTWLEHRRWNAYMRSIGFTYNTKQDKDMRLKLHGCLCECSQTPISGNDDIRINDLKIRLYNYVVDKDKEFGMEGFHECVKIWIRLPKKKETVNTDKLVGILEEKFDKIVMLRKDIMGLKQKYQDEIDRLKKKGLSKAEEESKTKEIREKDEIKNGELNKLLDEIVNSCARKNSTHHDMLDLASIRKGSDMKYFDYPQKTDEKLIETYRKMKKENI